jgi:hypothetical protein
VEEPNQAGDAAHSAGCACGDNSLRIAGFELEVSLLLIVNLLSCHHHLCIALNFIFSLILSLW